MTYRIRRSKPWGNDRIYLDNRPVAWTPGGRLGAVVDSIRPLLEGRWVEYSREEIEGALASLSLGSEFFSAEDLLAALSTDDRYEVEALVNERSPLPTIQSPLPSAEPSMRVTFFVNTGSEYFRNWISQYTAMAYREYFPTENGRVVLQQMRPTDMAGQRMTMQASYLVPNGTDEQLFEIGAGIELRLLPLTAERTEVSLVCSHPATKGYFVTMLEEAARRWPEIKPTLAGIAADELELGSPEKRAHVGIVALTNQQEAEFQQYQYKSRLPLLISGAIPARQTNVIKIGDVDVPLSDDTFALLLRLTLALKENLEGYVFKGDRIRGGGLVAEGFLNAEGIDQRILRLRQAVRPALGGMPYADFIEGRLTKHIRLSTHPALITVQARLLKHPNDLIKGLARKLIPSPVANAEPTKPDQAAD